MVQGLDYEPCPHCSANNITFRQICWRCGYDLPYMMGLDGQRRLRSDVMVFQEKRVNVQELLEQAQVVDFVEERKRHDESVAAIATEEANRVKADAKSRFFAWLRFGNVGSRKPSS